MIDASLNQIENNHSIIYKIGCGNAILKRFDDIWNNKKSELIFSKLHDLDVFERMLNDLDNMDQIEN